MSQILLKSLKSNMEIIKDYFTDCEDIIYREFEVGQIIKVKMSLIYIDGLVDSDTISEHIIRSLFLEEELKTFTEEGFRTTILEGIMREGLSASDVGEATQIEKILDAILIGDTVLLMDNIDIGLLISTKMYPNRGVEEPKIETVIRGPRDGFAESLRTNTALVRRRIRDTNLKTKMYKIGRRSKTSVVMMYIEDIVNKDIVTEVNNRLNSIDIDAVLDSSILENLIEDNYLSPFPQLSNTERPDEVAGGLYEGRVALIVDNSPFALIIPGTIGTHLQSTEDYYTRWTEATPIRLLRFIAMFLTLLSPGLYVAITAFHPGLLPTKLIYFIAASRVTVPFPAVIETIIMEGTMELIRESGTRISGPVGTTIGIVGGLIIGQAAVEAGIVSPIIIIVVAISTISSFAIPSYELSAALRISRFVFIVFAGVLGLYGIILGLIILISHLLKMNSFGVPYMSPYSGLGIKEGDLKDTAVKAPIQYLQRRPGFTSPINKIRMRLKR